MPSGNHPHSMKPSFMMKRLAGPPSPPPTPPLTQFQIYEYVLCTIQGAVEGGGGSRTAAQLTLKIKQIKKHKNHETYISQSQISKLNIPYLINK